MIGQRPSAQTAAALRLEAELDRILYVFALEHGGLVREACSLPANSADLAPVVVTTMFGHVAAKMRRLHGRERTERTLSLLLEQLDRAEVIAETVAQATRKELD